MFGSLGCVRLRGGRGQGSGVTWGGGVGVINTAIRFKINGNEGCNNGGKEVGQ